MTQTVLMILKLYLIRESVNHRHFQYLVSFPDANNETVLNKIMVVSRKLPTYPSPNLTFCPKKELSVNVRLGSKNWYNKNPRVRTYIFPGQPKQVLTSKGYLTEFLGYLGSSQVRIFCRKKFIVSYRAFSGNTVFFLYEICLPLLKRMQDVNISYFSVDVNIFN